MSLWRYINTDKFVSLLKTQSIHFARGDQFEDPLEGSYPKTAIDVFEGTGGYSAEGWRKFSAISCWCENDFESDAMWKLYCANSNGLAIKTSWQKLESVLDNRAYLTRVTYIDFIKDNADIYIPSDVYKYKRKAFSHENEVRAIISKYPKSGILNGIPLNSEPFDGQELPEFGVNLEVDISNLIDNVVIAPTRSSWFLDVIYDLCAKYGLPANIVTESELRADPVYGGIAK